MEHRLLVDPPGTGDSIFPMSPAACSRLNTCRPDIHIERIQIPSVWKTVSSQLNLVGDWRLAGIQAIEEMSHAKQALMRQLFIGLQRRRDDQERRNSTAVAPLNEPLGQCPSISGTQRCTSRLQWHSELPVAEAARQRAMRGSEEQARCNGPRNRSQAHHRLLSLQIDFWHICGQRPSILRTGTKIKLKPRANRLRQLLFS